jgi:hypothetical protein
MLLDLDVAALELGLATTTLGAFPLLAVSVVAPAAAAMFTLLAFLLAPVCRLLNLDADAAAVLLGLSTAGLPCAGLTTLLELEKLWLPALDTPADPGSCS